MNKASLRNNSVKKARKESLFLREISSLYLQASYDDPQLPLITITNVELSSDKGLCKVFFYCPEGKEHFETILDRLILYKPSLRKALASRIDSRYTPDIIFTFDTQQAKHLRVEYLIEKVKGEQG